MKVKDVGEAGLVGIGGTVGRKVADAVDRRTPLNGDVVAALIGFGVLAMTVRRVVRIAQRLRRAA